MRVKARALGLAAEDYENDKALGDDEMLYAGTLVLPARFWDTQPENIESWKEGAHTFYRVHGSLVQQMLINQFVYFEQPGETSLYARVTEIRGDSAVLKTLRDCAHPKQSAWGVTARNREQNFAMNLLLDPEIDLVTLAGFKPAGVLCELTNDDGTMARAPECITFARLHNMPVVTIEDLVEYRQAHERKAS